MHRSSFVRARSTSYFPMLFRSNSITPFQWIVECIGFEPMAQNEDITWILLSRSCLYRLFSQRCNIILYQFYFGVLQALQVMGRKYYTLAARSKLSYL